MPADPVSTIPLEWVYAIGAGLTAGLCFLAKTLISRTKESDKTMLARVEITEEKLAACEEKHDSTTNTLIELTGRLGRLEGKQDGVTAFAKEALEVIDRNTRNDARRS